MSRISSIVFAGALAFAWGLSVTGPAAADAVADFYKGKKITILVGFGAGGGVDTFGRLLGRQLGKYVPGGPSVVVQNMPGGGGFKSTNYIYNAAPQDGSYITIMLSSNAIAPLMGNRGAKWDTFKLHWLGNLTRDYGSCIASGRSGIRSITEAANRRIILGATGPSALSAQQAYALTNLLGYKIKVILGYKGTKAIWLAMEKGEVEGVCTFWASLGLGPQNGNIKAGRFVPIIQLGSKNAPIFGNAPNVYDLAKSDEDRKVMQFVFGVSEIARPFAAPPGVPADRVAALRKAFWDTVTGPELKADAAKLNLVIDPQDWKETEQAFRKILSMPKAIVDRAKKVIRRPKS